MRKIPVWKTVGEAYAFTFGHLGTIIGLIWLPMVIVAVVGYFVMAQYYQVLPSALEGGDAAAAGRSALVVLLWGVVSLALSAMMYSAVTRQALGLRQGPAAINFQFGAVELRVFGAVLALIFLLFVLMFVYISVVGGAVGALQTSGAQPNSGTALAVGLFALLALPAMFFVMVRLSFLLIPVTVAEGKIGLAHGWQMTGGNFWRIFLIGLCTLGPVLLVAAGAEIAILGSGFFMPHNVPAGDADAQMRELIAEMRASAPHMPLLYGFSFLIAPVALGLGISPSAFAYKALTQPG